MRALGKHKILASCSASTKLLNSKQTLWSQTNYNSLYTDIVYSKHVLLNINLYNHLDYKRYAVGDVRA